MTSVRLPLSAFEHLMVAQDSPAYPCVVYCKMDFHGSLNRQVFDSCLREMLDRHPLLRSRVERYRSGLRWVEEASGRVPVQWLSTAPAEDWVADSRLDLFQEVGMRVFVHEFADACEIIFQCHHACVDGLGLQTALGDLWLLYDSRTKETERPIPRYEPRLLPKRNLFGLTFRRALYSIPKQAVGLLGVRQYLMRNPVPVVPHQVISDAQSSPLTASYHVERFDNATLRSLRRTASQRNATLNELVATSVFEAIANFRRKRALQNQGEWIRMMVPINMRTTDQDARQTACNIVSSVFLDRNPAQIEDRAGLLAGVHEEMNLIKRNRLGLIFIASLWVKKRMPSKVVSDSAPGRCQTTVVVTNLGRVFSTSPLLSPQGYFHTGNLKLESVTMLAPMTPYLSAAFTVSEYAGELTIVLRYDHRILNAEDARELLDSVAASLRNWIALPSETAEA